MFMSRVTLPISDVSFTLPNAKSLRAELQWRANGSNPSAPHEEGYAEYDTATIEAEVERLETWIALQKALTDLELAGNHKHWADSNLRSAEEALPRCQNAAADAASDLDAAKAAFEGLKARYATLQAE